MYYVQTLACYWLLVIQCNQHGLTSGPWQQKLRVTGHQPTSPHTSRTNLQRGKMPSLDARLRLLAPLDGAPAER